MRQFLRNFTGMDTHNGSAHVHTVRNLQDCSCTSTEEEEEDITKMLIARHTLYEKHNNR